MVDKKALLRIQESKAKSGSFCNSILPPKIRAVNIHLRQADMRSIGAKFQLLPIDIMGVEK